ncbi:HAMP domain-containing histidine kinase [Bacteroidales bacterium OttesenSCG-928-I14]|nr:HAMP domain-containing histidine kinase [Bacteroidales bacterium OttesenSCG-928-I14]
MYKVLKVLVLIAFLSLTHTSRAMENKLDSIHKIIERTTIDTTKVNLYLELAGIYNFTDADSLHKYAQLALDLSEQIGWKEGIVKSANRLSVYYNMAGEPDAVLRLSFIMLDNNPSQYYFLLATRAISSIYLSNKQYDKAFEYAEKIVNNNDLYDEYRAMGYSFKADIFKLLNEPDSARVYFESAIELLKEPVNEFEISTKIQTLVQYSTVLEDPVHVYRVNMEARELYEKLKPHPRLYSLVLHSYVNAGIKLLESGVRDKSIKKSKQELLDELQGILSYLDELSQTPGYEYLILETAKKMQQFYALKKDYEKAYLWSIKYHDLENDFFSQENKNKLADVENERLTERYEHEMYVQQLELDAKKKRQNLYTLTIFLLVVITLLMIFYNINRKRANMNLAKLNKDLAESNAVKTKLFSIINHDLRKPVANLIGYLKFKEKSPQAISEEDKIQIEKETLEMSENLLQLMEELLLWSKSQIDSFNPLYKQTAISSLFEDISLLAKDGVNIDVNIDRDIDISIDPYYIKTIIRNLTSNAVHAAVNSPTPCVQWTMDSDAEYVYLTITNNGKELNEKQKEILTKGATSGNISQGLGLSIIHDFAKTTNSRISINENHQQGTTSITLALSKKSS